MSKWSGEHRAFVIEAFFKNGDSYVNARQQFCSHYNIRRLSDGPSIKLIRSWVQRFRKTASALNTLTPGPKRTSRTAENIRKVKQSLVENPRFSIRKRASTLGLPKSIVQEIVQKDLELCPRESNNEKHLKALLGKPKDLEPKGIVTKSDKANLKRKETYSKVKSKQPPSLICIDIDSSSATDQDDSDLEAEGNQV